MEFIHFFSSKSYFLIYLFYLFENDGNLKKEVCVFFALNKKKMVMEFNQLHRFFIDSSATGARPHQFVHCQPATQFQRERRRRTACSIWPSHFYPNFT